MDYETLRQFRPDLIYVENTGYGRVGPSAERAGADVVVQAYSGLMAGDGKVDDSGTPQQITASPTADYMAAVAAAMGVCAALYHRERTGEGQYIETSLLAAGLAQQTHIVSCGPPYDAIVRDPMMERIAEIRRDGGSYADIVAERTKQTMRVGGGFRLYYRGYQASDGAVIIGALTDHNRDQIRSVLGITDDPTASADFNTMDVGNQRLVDEMRERIEAIFRTRTMDEWIADLDAVGAPAAKVNLPEEMADDPQVEAAGLMIELEHALTGPDGSWDPSSGSPPRLLDQLSHPRRWTDTRMQCCVSLGWRMRRSDICAMRV